MNTLIKLNTLDWPKNVPIYIYLVDIYLKEISSAPIPRLFKTQLGPVEVMQLLAFRLGIEPATPRI